MALTKLSRNFLIAVWCSLLYAFFGGYGHPIITFLLTTGILLWLVFLLSIPKNEDMDMLTAFCIHARGVICPKGESPMTMTQNCLVYFEGKLPFDTLKQHIISRLYKYKRLSSIGVLPSPNAALWSTRWQPIDITDDVINRQILAHSVSSNSELYALVDKLTNEQLPSDLPLWRFHYIENTADDGLSMWVWRVSHGISDGIRLVSIASTLLQNAEGGDIGAPKGSILSAKKSDPSAPRKKKRRGPNWMNPKTYVQLFEDLYSVWFSINGPCDTLNAFKPDGRVHGGEQIHIRNEKAISIDDVKVIKNKFGVSFNDVMTALTCSGIRRYILARDGDFFKKGKGSKFTMTSLLAFGFPPKEKFEGQSDWLRNGFTMVDWAFPVEIEDFAKRLMLIHRNGKKLKRSFVTPIVSGATEFMARLGMDGTLDENTTQMFGRHTCVFSNLPSWDEQLYYEGVKVRKLEASYHNYLPQFIFISYNGGIYGTLVCNPERFPDAQIIFDGIQEELQRQTK